MNKITLLILVVIILIGGYEYSKHQDKKERENACKMAIYMHTEAIVIGDEAAKKLWKFRQDTLCKEFTEKDK